MLSVIILTHNAEDFIQTQLESIFKQTLLPTEILILDSESTDNTLNIVQKCTSQAIKIRTFTITNFNHGLTRAYGANMALELYLVYLTHDAILYDKYALEFLMNKLKSNLKIGACFGRQLPNKKASLFASHLRYFNYPEEDYIRTLEDKYQYGLKTCFFSDSFSIYKREALKNINYFPKTHFGEDTLVAGKLLLAGYSIAYASKAKAIHSHNYSIIEEFKRYKEIGKFHKEHPWLLKEFESSTGEGIKYVLSELNFIMKNTSAQNTLILKILVLTVKKCYLLILSVYRSGMKYLGYKVGYYFS